MNTRLDKAIAALEAARPASGSRPESQAEWLALLKAQEEMGYAMMRDQGKSDAESRAMARFIFGGAAGLMLLDMAFSEKPNV